MQHTNSWVDKLFKNQEETKKGNEELELNLKIACEDVFKNKNGIFLAKFIKEICLWDKEADNLNSESALYQRGRRDIWLILRAFIPAEILAKIEIYK